MKRHLSTQRTSGLKDGIPLGFTGRRSGLAGNDKPPSPTMKPQIPHVIGVVVRESNQTVVHSFRDVVGSYSELQDGAIP
jgi:hypothetical protein